MSFASINLLNFLTYINFVVRQFQSMSQFTFSKLSKSYLNCRLITSLKSDTYSPSHGFYQITNYFLNIKLYKLLGKEII